MLLLLCIRLFIITIYYRPLTLNDIINVVVKIVIIGFVRTGFALLSSLIPPLEKVENCDSQNSVVEPTNRSYPSQIVEWADFHASVIDFHVLDSISLAVSPVVLADNTVIDESALKSKFIICFAEYLNVLGAYIIQSIGEMRNCFSKFSSFISCLGDVMCMDD